MFKRVSIVEYNDNVLVLLQQSSFGCGTAL